MEGFNNAICGGADILRVIKFVFILLRLVNWIVPMALIVIISIDFGKNVMANKEDEMKKNVSIVVKRIIFCIALFFVMPIVEFVIGMLGDTASSGDKSWLDCIAIAKSEDDFSAYEVDWNFGVESEGAGANSATENSDSSASSGNNSSSTSSDNKDKEKEETIKIDVSGYSFKSDKIKKLVAEGKTVEVEMLEQFWINGVRNVELKKLVYNKETGNYKNAYDLTGSNSKEYTISELATFEIKKVTEVTSDSNIDLDKMEFKDSKIKELVKNKKPIEIGPMEQLYINGQSVVLASRKLVYNSERNVYTCGLTQYTIEEWATAEIKEIALKDAIPR